jgi:hypothetical protein
MKTSAFALVEVSDVFADCLENMGIVSVNGWFVRNEENIPPSRLAPKTGART